MHENVWSPWRYAYLQDLERRRDAAGEGPHEAEDFLATYWASPELDAEHRVIFRDDRGIILLNRYPYANGHLMAALGEAQSTLMAYDAQQRAALWGLVEIAVERMQRCLRPQGINVGINEGRAAGAGLPEHLHAHIVPRWHGDTNFMSTVGEVRVVPSSLEDMWKRYTAES